MHDEMSLKEIQKEWHGSYRAYAIGFIGSLLFTLLSFFLVLSQTLIGAPLVYTLSGLSLTQAILQFVFFLHVGQEPKPKWETVLFAFMILVLLIIVLGTLWIMHDLNDRVMVGM